MEKTMDAATETATETTTTTVTENKAVRARAKEAYERLVQRITDELKEAGKVGRKQWEDAVKSARDFVQKAKPELKRDDLEKLGDTVRKDLRHALRSFKDRGEDWTRSQAFLTARDRGAQVLLRLAQRLKDAAEAVESNLQETLRYKKGEVVSGGRFLCTACSEEQKLEESGALQSCARCAKEEFRRSS